ncbi:MAG: hypothetical protein C4518_06020 [Desulfobacteraceae bacterium]|nr:MAG: hypothetical protein C4518_06020 [Desulfobacteraceae bacterium]
MSPDLPSPRDRSKTMITIVAAAIAAAAIGYMGYHQFMQWHEKEVRTAVSQQQQEMKQAKADLESPVQIVRKPSSLETPPAAAPAVSGERLTEVFGSAPVATTPETESEPSCDRLNRRIASFFDYLRQHTKPSSDPGKTVSPDWVAQMIIDLVASPPLVAEEIRDMENLKRNESHFFRVLKKDRMNMVKTLLLAEKDVLEHALADCYQYYVSIGCCNPGDPACVSLKTLYEYAGFFMTTFSGKSYLLRRNSTIRCLTDYYCVLILDQANDAELNPYGIDIRPYIGLAMDAVTHQNNLIFRDRYIATLNRLTIKYPPPFQPVLPDTTEDDHS